MACRVVRGGSQWVAVGRHGVGSWWVTVGCCGAAWRGLTVGRGFGLRGDSFSLD